MKSHLLAVDTEIVMHELHRAVRSHRDMQGFVYQKVISRTLADHPEVVHEGEMSRPFWRELLKLCWVTPVAVYLAPVVSPVPLIPCGWKWK